VPAPAVVRLITADGVGLVADFWPDSGDVPTSRAERAFASGRSGLAPPPSTSPAHRSRSGDLAVVVCHGFTLSARAPAVRAICRRIADAGVPVLAVDFRGHGRSAGLGTAGHLEVHDVAAAVAWLRDQGFARVAVLGWSMGGSVVLRYAGLGGAADAVVSVSSPGAWFERGTRSMRIVHWVCETRSGRVAARMLRRTRLSPGGWPEVPESPSEVAGRIAPTPLLIVHGDADRYFPMRHVDLLAAAAPTAALWVEAGMGHAETATSPELVDRILGWVQSVVQPVTADAPVCDDGSRD
jgi:pimeloyl-ACP methyl ester carboxylesterase